MRHTSPSQQSIRYVRENASEQRQPAIKPLFKDLSKKLNSISFSLQSSLSLSLCQGRCSKQLQAMKTKYDGITIMPAQMSYNCQRPLQTISRTTKHGPSSQKHNKTLRGVTQWLQTFTKPMEKPKKPIHLLKNQIKCCKVTKITKKNDLF